MSTVAFGAARPYLSAGVLPGGVAHQAQSPASNFHDDTSVNSFTLSTSPTSTQPAVYALNVGGTHIDVASELLACLPQGNLLHAAIAEGPHLTAQPGTTPRVFVPRSPNTFRLVVEYYSNDRRLPKGLPDHVISALKMEASHFALQDLHAECKVFYPLRRRARAAKATGATQVRVDALQALAWALRQHGLLREARRKQLRAAQLMSELLPVRGGSAHQADAPPSRALAAPPTRLATPTPRRLPVRASSRDASSWAHQRPSTEQAGLAPNMRAQQPTLATPLAVPQPTAPTYQVTMATSWPPMPARTLAPHNASGPGQYAHAQGQPAAPAPLFAAGAQQATPKSWPQPIDTVCAAACGPGCFSRAPLGFQDGGPSMLAGVPPALISPVSYGTQLFGGDLSPAYPNVALPFASSPAVPASPGLQAGATWPTGVLASSAPAALGFVSSAPLQQQALWPQASQTLSPSVAPDVVLPEGMALETFTAGSDHELTNGAAPSWDQTFARVRTWSAEVAAQGGPAQTQPATPPPGPSYHYAFPAPVPGHGWL